MASEVVPFGKYKGQPVEAMVGDQQYIDWLMGQSWFRERYQGIYTLIINNFQEPSETPEHNALQARFLNDDACMGVIVASGLENNIRKLEDVYLKWIVDDRMERVARAQKALNEAREYLLKIHDRIRDQSVNDTQYHFWSEKDLVRQEDLIRTRGVDLIEAESGLSDINERIASGYELSARPVDFEILGWDVLVQVKSPNNTANIYIELKPSLGDDYPVVLRQMKMNARSVKINNRDSFGLLVIGKFCATGASLDQVIAIFDMAGFRVAVYP